jgi:hypothetical protein
VNEDEGAGSGSPEEVPQGSVFGNLPDARPGVPSPRRAGLRRARTPEPEGAEAEATRPEPPIETAVLDEPPSAPPDVEPDAAEGEPGRGIEDVAWAGVAAAAEAATIGVRIANRAFEALRDAVERR